MSAFRLEIRNTNVDTRSNVLLSKLKKDSFDVSNIFIIDVYTIAKEFDSTQKGKIADMLTNKVFEEYKLNTPNVKADFDYAIEIGYLSGVTDNLGRTTIQAIEDLFKIKFKIPDEDVYSSKVVFIKGNIEKKDAEKIALELCNPIIQRIHIKSKDEFEKDNGMDIIIPKVIIQTSATVTKVDLDISDKELNIIGQKGVPNEDGTCRGPLALRPSYMKVIQSYFKDKGRMPTDIEIESIAQTWSEHCKHTIFADPIDEIKDGIYKHYIKRATKEIRKKKGADDFCVSVFTDNSGAIKFDENYFITDKVETHNSPAAIDPFGAAMTGVVGVNRDTVGFGKGAKPVMNRYGYCFGNPQDDTPLYKGKNKTNKALSPRQVMDGVIAGVNSGGNESGIPTTQGFCYFDERYRGKPLVFVGTIGLIPREVKGTLSFEKQAQPGDKVVIVGGRVGLDGIHGATFSSEALSDGSPATAVQIGDPITQKKLSDVICKEARDLGLYTSITDNGAGGISCSVAEMAKECGGCLVNIEKNLQKYANLNPWEIWISESQERMTLAVSPEKLDQFTKLMEKRDVEYCVIGEFTDSGYCKVMFNGKTIMDLDMDFLHDGMPPEQLNTTYTKEKYPEAKFDCPKDLGDTLCGMLSRNSITSFEFISQQYDHEVQAGSVLKPLQGKGRVNGSASISRPVLNSQKGVVLSQGLAPRYSDIDTYHMAASSIDTSVRNAVSVGANIDYLAILDNFCWCSSDEPERLGQLKEAGRACFDTAVAYGTPFISGKDSMFNDFKGFDENNNPIKISIPPTLLVSAIGVMENVEKCVSMDVKFAEDLVYLIGETKDELGGSEYFYSKNVIGNNVPKVNTTEAYERYQNFYKAIQENLIASSISIEIGGLGVALAKMAISGAKGVDIDLSNVLKEGIDRDDYLLFSETQSRFVVTINPKNKDKFEQLFPKASNIGVVRNDDEFNIKGLTGEIVVNNTVKELEESYKKTFRNY